MKIWTSLKVSIVGLALAVLPSAAFAGPTYSALTTIPYVVAYQSGYVVFSISTAPSSPWAACNANHQFVIGTSSVGSAAIFNTIIRAEQDAKTVYIVGKGTCTMFSQIEDADFVQINP